MGEVRSVTGLLARHPERVAAVAAAAGVPEHLVSHHRVEPLPCVLTNLTTADLARVRFGEPRDGASLVVKIAQSPVHSAVWAEIPPHLHQQVLLDLPWRAEADLYASSLGAALPEGMRMPVVYAIDPLGQDRITLWMEDIEQRATAWGSQDYRMAARVLGRLGGRLPEQKIPAEIPVGRRDFRSYFFGRVTHGSLPALRDDATWTHPLIADTVDPLLRHDLESRVAAMPALLDRLDELPPMFAHGDACPQNLLLPASEPATVVAIDWTFAGVAGLGLDAAQLIAGRAESGELDPAELADVLDDVITAYGDGLTDAGASVDPALVHFGVVANLVVRSAFTALPVEALAGPPTDQLQTLFSRRGAYARFLVDLGLALVPGLRART